MSGKQKTHQGMKKRVKKTGNGKLKREKAYQSHLLEKKGQAKKQSFRKESNFDDADRKKVKKLLKK
jgi:large subunit ribosomal protein L35